MTYYWQVEAVDQFGARTTSNGPGWIFYTDNTNFGLYLEHSDPNTALTSPVPARLEGEVLEIYVAQVGGIQYQGTLRETSSHLFTLITGPQETQQTVENSVTFDFATGQLLLPVIDFRPVGWESQTCSMMMGLEPGTSPLQFQVIDNTCR
ncbi:MAG: hypothetical protein HC877_13385 [Thioploca sp.]|nr:hypothetical protein [Thioploca sp.]